MRQLNRLEAMRQDALTGDETSDEEPEPESEPEPELSEPEPESEPESEPEPDPEPEPEPEQEQEQEPEPEQTDSKAEADVEAEFERERDVELEIEQHNPLSVAKSLVYLGLARKQDLNDIVIQHASNDATIEADDASTEDTKPSAVEPVDANDFEDALEALLRNNSTTNDDLNVSNDDATNKDEAASKVAVENKVVVSTPNTNTLSNDGATNEDDNDDEANKVEVPAPTMIITTMETAIILHPHEREKLSQEHLGFKKKYQFRLDNWGTSEALEDFDEENEDDDIGWIRRDEYDFLPVTDSTTSFGVKVTLYNAFFTCVAQTQHPRTLSEGSRRPFNMFENFGGLEDLHALFFNSKGLFSDKVSTDFDGRHVYPTKIGFDANKDLRIQLEFNDTSSVHAAVKKLLHNYAIIDEQFEDIEDVSMLIGGTAIQSCHTDIARIYAYWSDNEQSSEITENVKRNKYKSIHEVGRNEYNQAVDCEYGMSSIIIDLSVDNSGFALAIPKMFIEKNDDGLTGKMIFSDQMVTITDDVGDIFIVTVPTGCQFTGDFVHAGANNVAGKLLLKDQKKFKVWIEKVANHFLLQDVPLMELFQLINQHKIQLSKVTRFFCKTYPKSNKIVKAKENVSFPISEVNEFKNIIESYAKIKESSKKTGKTQNKTNSKPVTNPESSSPIINMRGSPRRSTRNVNDAAIASSAQDSAAKRKWAPSAEKMTSNQTDFATPVTVKSETTGTGKGVQKKQKQTNDTKANLKTPPTKEFASTKMRNVGKKRTASKGGVGIPLVHKHLLSRPRVRVIQPKSFAKREERAEKHFGNVNERIMQKEMMEYTTTPLESTNSITVNSACLISKTFCRMNVASHAFSKYFGLDRLEDDYDTLQEEGFRICIDNLWKACITQINSHQRAWFINVNHKEPLIAKSYEWLYCMKFDKWWISEGTKKGKKEKKKEDKTNPETEWFYLTEKNEDDLGLFSRRVFVKDEVIGIYFGTKPIIEERSKYAINTPYGVFDPLRGHTHCGGTPCYYMALHEAKVASGKEIANAILLKSLLVKATTTIELGDEIILSYDTDVSSAYSFKL